MLEKGEASLPKRSVVNVTQVFSVDKRTLDERIGTLPQQRIQQVLDGVRLVIGPREVDE